MDVQAILDIVKTMMPGFFKQTLAEQSSGPSGIERILTGWFRGKKQTTILKEDETEMVLMFREVDGVLLMIPTIINADDQMVRGLLEHSINVTEFCTRIPAIDLLPVLIKASKEKGADKDIKLMQTLLTTLREAANHPDCRLQVADEEEETPPPYNQEAAQAVVKEGFSSPEPPEVDALGYVEEDEEEDDELQEYEEEEDEDELVRGGTITDKERFPAGAATDENTDTHS